MIRLHNLLCPVINSSCYSFTVFVFRPKCMYEFVSDRGFICCIIELDLCRFVFCTVLMSAVSIFILHYLLSVDDFDIALSSHFFDFFFCEVVSYSSCDLFFSFQIVSCEINGLRHKFSLRLLAAVWCSLTCSRNSSHGIESSTFVVSHSSVEE